MHYNQDIEHQCVRASSKSARFCSKRELLHTRQAANSFTDCRLNQLDLAPKAVCQQMGYLLTDVTHVSREKPLPSHPDMLTGKQVFLAPVPLTNLLIGVSGCGGGLFVLRSAVDGPPNAPKITFPAHNALLRSSSARVPRQLAGSRRVFALPPH